MGKIILYQKGKPGVWWNHEIAEAKKANKEWSCKECYGTIKKGDKYIDDQFIGEGEWLEKITHHHRVCLICWRGPL